MDITCYNSKKFWYNETNIKRETKLRRRVKNNEQFKNWINGRYKQRKKIPSNCYLYIQILHIQKQKYNFHFKFIFNKLTNNFFHYYFACIWYLLCKKEITKILSILHFTKHVSICQDQHEACGIHLTMEATLICILISLTKIISKEQPFWKTTESNCEFQHEIEPSIQKLSVTHDSFRNFSIFWQLSKRKWQTKMRKTDWDRVYEYSVVLIVEIQNFDSLKRTSLSKKFFTYWMNEILRSIYNFTVFAKKVSDHLKLFDIS
jgi:hypothetical protein